MVYNPARLLQQPVPEEKFVLEAVQVDEADENFFNEIMGEGNGSNDPLLMYPIANDYHQPTENGNQNESIDQREGTEDEPIQNSQVIQSFGNTNEADKSHGPTENPEELVECRQDKLIQQDNGNIQPIEIRNELVEHCEGASGGNNLNEEPDSEEFEEETSVNDEGETIVIRRYSNGMEMRSILDQQIDAISHPYQMKRNDELSGNMPFQENVCASILNLLRFFFSN